MVVGRIHALGYRTHGYQLLQASRTESMLLQLCTLREDPSLLRVHVIKSDSSRIIPFLMNSKSNLITSSKMPSLLPYNILTGVISHNLHRFHPHSRRVNSIRVKVIRES